MTDRDYMKRAMELAKKGTGYTSPNPMVGAVIVKNGVVIGEGYHQAYGSLHAEREAIANLKESAKGATIYVTLEPCCHYGKTPPCTEAIIEAGITRVVYGSSDPNPLVSGKGEKQLKEAGISVEAGVLQKECDEINRIFFHYITKKTPYMVMKYAMTADGKIATKTGASKWITGEQARQVVQQMRHQYRGILVGIDTVIADDPMLTVRDSTKRSPVRIICDSRGQIPLQSNICKTAKEYETIVAVCNMEKEKRVQLEELGVRVFQVGEKDGHVDLEELLHRLGQEQVDSVLVEGGGTINDSFVRQGLINEVKVFVGAKIFGGKNSKTPVAGLGVEVVEEAQALQLNGVEQIGEDVLLSYINNTGYPIGFRRWEQSCQRLGSSPDAEAAKQQII